MATPRSIASTSQAMGALLINQQPVSTTDATQQQFQEATCTHVAANTEPKDSIAELCLFTYILRCGGVLGSGWRVNIDKRRTFICYPPEEFVPANGEKRQRRYTHRTNVARAMGLEPFGARKRKRSTDVPPTADVPAAGAAPPTPMLTEHSVLPGVEAEQFAPGVTHSQPHNRKLQNGNFSEAVSKAHEEHRAVKRQRSMSASVGNTSADRTPAQPSSPEEISSGQVLLPDYEQAAADPPAQPDVNLPEAVLEDMLATICADIPAQDSSPTEVAAAELQQADYTAASQRASDAAEATFSTDNPQQEKSPFSGVQIGDLQQKYCRVIKATAPDAMELQGCVGSVLPDSNLIGEPQVAQLTNPCWDAPDCAAPSPDADADADADAHADGDMDDVMDDDIGTELEDDLDADMEDGIDAEVHNGTDLSGSALHPLEKEGDLRSLPPAVMAEMFLRELLGGSPPVGTQLPASETTDQHAATLLKSNVGAQDPDRSAPGSLAVSSVKEAEVHAVSTVQGKTASAACLKGNGPSAEGSKPSGVAWIAPQPLPERPAQSAVAFRLTATRRPLKDTCAQDFEEMVARGRKESSHHVAEAFAMPRRAPSAACGSCAAQCTIQGSTNTVGADAVVCRRGTGSKQQSPEPATKPTGAVSIQGPPMQDAGVFGAQAPGDEPEPVGRSVAQASAAMQAPRGLDARCSSNKFQQHDGAKSTEVSLAGWMHTTQALVSCAATEDPDAIREPVRGQEQEPMHLGASIEPAGAETLYGFTLVNDDRLHVGRSDEEGPQPCSPHAGRHAALDWQRSRADIPDLRCGELLSKDDISTSGQHSGGEQPGKRRSQSQEQQGPVAVTDQLTRRCVAHLAKESGIDATAFEGHQAEEEGSSAAMLAALKSTSNAAAEFVAQCRAGIPAYTTVGKCMPDQAIMPGSNGFFMPGRCTPDQAMNAADSSPGAGLIADCNTWQVPRVLQGSTGAQNDSNYKKVSAEQEFEAKGGSSPRYSQQSAEQSSQPNHARSSQLPAVHAGREETSHIALLQQYISQSATSATKSISLSENGDGTSVFAALREYASQNTSDASASNHNRTSSTRAEMQSKPRDTGHLLPHSPSMSDSRQLLAPQRNPLAEEPNASFEGSQSQRPESSLHINLALSDAESESMGRVEEGNSRQSKPGSTGCMQMSESLNLHLNLTASESAAEGGSVEPPAQRVLHEIVWKVAQVDTDDGSSFDQDDKIMDQCQECSGQDSPAMLLRDLARTSARLKESQMQLDAQASQQDPAREMQKQMVHEKIACFIEHLKAATMAAEGTRDWE